MASGNLVPVGHVFKVFADDPKRPPVIGVEVTGHPFGTRNRLAFRPSDAEVTFVELRVVSIEYDHSRTNVAKTDKGNTKQYGVQLLFPTDFDSTNFPQPGWLIEVPKSQSIGAAQRTPKTWPRPTRPQVAERTGQSRVW